MLELFYKSSNIRIHDEPTFTFASSDNPRIYKYESRLDSGKYRYSSAHGVTVVADNVVIASHLVATCGGATGVHNNSAVVVDDRCVVAVGPYLVAFSLPTLEIDWSTQVDLATAFGVHLSADGNFLLSHGELTICRINFDGQIEWQARGTDIFSEGLFVEDTCVRVVDFDKCEYQFDLATGKPIAL